MKKKILVYLVILAIVVAILAIVFLPRIMAPAVPYSLDLKVAQRAYMDVVSIDPSYSISQVVNGLNTGSNHELVCACVTTEGESVWVHFDTTEYFELIDPSLKEYLYDPEAEFWPVKYFEEPVRITGIIVPVDAVCEDMGEDLDQKYILSFMEME